MDRTVDTALAAWDWARHWRWMGEPLVTTEQGVEWCKRRARLGLVEQWNRETEKDWPNERRATSSKKIAGKQGQAVRQAKRMGNGCLCWVFGAGAGRAVCSVAN